jgi:hypothetical protein
MTDVRPPRSVSSSAWTGPPPATPHSGMERGFRPRWEPGERRAHTVAGLLLVVGFLAFVAWYVALGSRSAVAPSPETGHTEALLLFSLKAPPIYVRPTEALIAYALLLAAFVVPVAYLLGWEALQRRSKR